MVNFWYTFVMKLNNIAKLFGSDEEPILLTGGQGNTYKSNNIILKPTSNQTESEELSELVKKAPPSEKLRIPKPIKSSNNNWVEDGYVAWEYLEGKDLKDNYEQKLQICDWFSEIFKNIEKPDFIEKRNDAWAIADRVTWGEIEKEYGKEFQEIINQVKSILIPIAIPAQIIHGDISENIISDKKDSFGVIDITIYWRPRDYAKALLIVDGITWESADLNIYAFVKDLPEIKQLLLRAGLRRIIENPEHVERSNKNVQKALSESYKYLETLKSLNLL